MQHTTAVIQQDFFSRFEKPQAKSGWDEMCQKFEAKEKNPIMVKDRQTKQFRPATRAEIGRKLGLARFKEPDLNRFYQECLEADARPNGNFGRFFNWYCKQRTPRAQKQFTIHTPPVIQ
jgi:hypothetical protein